MASTAATLAIHLDFDLNGEPVTHFLKVPAQLEDMNNGAGLTVHLHIDARELARVILREMPSITREQTRLRTDGRTAF